MEKSTDAEELLRMISRNEFVIYGAGHIALKFLKVLKWYHLEGNVSCFVISSSEPGKHDMLEGIPVRNPEWLKEHKNSLVCIAVHEASSQEIIEHIQALGIAHYIWIYPYLYELMLGTPKETGIKIRLADIIQTCEDDYRIAIRYAAIENYFEKNSYGFDLYIKAQALHSSRKTAEARLMKFCELMRAWQENGYDEQSRIFINRKYEIIDGNHRVALAKYYDQQEILCDIFPSDISAAEVHGENAMLTKDVLLSGGFSLDEIAVLDKINERFQ